MALGRGGGTRRRVMTTRQSITLVDGGPEPLLWSAMPTSSLIGLAALALALASPAPPPPPSPSAPARVLVVTVTKGFRHDSIPDLERLLGDIAQKGGAFTVDYARTDQELADKTT